MEQLPYPPAPPVTRDDLPELGPGSVASLWYRAAARIFDGLVLAVPSLIVVLSFINLDTATKTGDPLAGLPYAARVGLVVGPIVYEFVFLAIWGATPGKMLLGLRVVAYVGGAKPAPYQIGVRLLATNFAGLAGLGNLPSGVLDVLGFLQPMVYLTAVVHPLARGLHDLAAGTIVLRTR